MGRKSSRSRVEEAQAAASDAREHAEASAEAPQVQVGGDASALASMFALSGSVFAKKASYASATEPKKSETKATKATAAKAAAAVESEAPKKLKKKEKKKQQQAAAEDKAATAAAAGEDKAAAKKQKKKAKKKQQKEQAQVETEERSEKPAAKKQKKQEKETAVEKVEKKTVDAATDADTEAAKKQKKKDKKKQKKLQAKLAASEKKEQVELTPTEKATTKKVKEVKEGATQAKREMSPEDEAKSRRTIFVGNVSLEATEKDVARQFTPCGKVESVRLRNMPVAGCKVDQAGNQKLMMKVCANKKIFTEKGETCNAYVVFASEESIPAALALNGSTLLSKKLRVDRESLIIDPKRSVFVGGIAFQLPDDQLRAFFNSRLRTDEEPEPVEHVRIIRDRETGVGKGFGYVLLKTQSLAAKALSLHETKLGTRQIRVQVSGKRFKNRRGEETDPSKKHEGLRAAAGAHARIQLKRKTRQGSEVSSSKRQKLDEAVKTIKPKHAARKARQAAEAAAAGAPSADSKKKGVKSGKSAKGAKNAKGGDGKHKHKSDRSSKKPKVKVQKPKHAARKARQAAEATAKAAASS